MRRSGQAVPPEGLAEAGRYAEMDLLNREVLAPPAAARKGLA